MKLMIMLLCWVWLRIGLRLPGAVLNLVDAIGRWAMLDVFVAALFVVTLKLKGVPVRLRPELRSRFWSWHFYSAQQRVGC